MKNLKYFIIALILPAFILTGCKDDPVDEAQPSYDILTEYLIDQDMDLNHIITTAEGVKFVTGAPGTDAEVAAWAEAFSILDIRSAADFALGHIVGAKNVAYGDLMTEAATASKKMLIVCYTGQTACFATSLLRLSGYNAQALKWGMSGWNADFDKWTANIANIADGHSNWTFESAPTTPVNENPVISSTATDGASILSQQVEKIFAEGFGANAIAGSEVLEGPSAYYTNNYFSQTDYLGFGHINSAYRVNPLLLVDNTMNGMDPNGKVITYCYTGQTSAVVTAYLNVIGFDAYSLKFGMNSLWNSNPAWTTNQWGGDSKSKDLAYEK